MVRIALKHCLMPNPKTVAAFDRAVFPSIRDQKRRMEFGEVSGRRVLLDDNVTPRWALLWSHGFKETGHLSGWTFAHVWAAPKNPDAYTHLANLCMMPEYFGSLSDKQGPLCAYLRYHAWERYNWHISPPPPEKPEGYEALEWRYLRAIDNPQTFVQERMQTLGNQRVLKLRELMLDAVALAQ